MSKQTPFLFFIIILIILVPLTQADALGIGPPEFELDLQMDESNSTTIYITSDGLMGKLVIMKENLPFQVEPLIINLTSTDVNMPVEITFYGNETIESGIYAGKLTFLAYTGSSVSVGIRIRAKINLIGETPETQEEPETNPQVGSEEMDYTPYIIGGVAGSVIVTSLVLIIVWLRRR